MDVEHEGLGSSSTVVAASLSPRDSSARAPAPLVLVPTQSSSSSRLAADAASLEVPTSPVASHGVVPPEIEPPSAFAVPDACSYDVYIGVFGTDPALIRYAKWMHAELETNHAVACFSADQSLYNDCDSSKRSHDIARSVMHSATHGVVLITRKSFRNPYTIEELTVFLSRGNLVPVFFDVTPADCLVQDIVEKQGDIWEVHGGELWKAYGGDEKAWSHVVEGLLTVEEQRVEAYNENWRDSIHAVAALVGSGLARTFVDELPWPRNGYFAGREKELKAMERILFPDDVDNAVPVTAASPSSETVAQTLARGSDASSKADFTEESELGRLSNCNDSESNHEEGITTGKDHHSPKEESWHRGSRDGSFSGSSLRDRRAVRAAGRSHREVHKRRDSADRRGESDRAQQFAPTCVLTGIPGIGKSELALEFAYRHSQKYRRVLWVGGESRYLRQSYLNLSTLLGVDVANTSTRVQPFEEQEASAVQKVRYELEKDTPCLLIIDNLDASRDSLDGREVGELLPRFGSAAHVVITTRLARVMHLESVEVPFLSSFEALTLMRDGKRSHTGSFSVHQIDKFKELETKLNRLPFGLALVGRLIDEFKLKPSALLVKMGPTVVEETTPMEPQPFLVKLLDVSFDLTCGGVNKSSMAMRMGYVGGWFAPALCPVSLLALAARKLGKELNKGVQMQPQVVTSMLSCWLPNSQNARSDADASALLTRLGLARASPREDCLYFPDIVQSYCRLRGGAPAARAFVRAVCKSGSLVQHFDHFWAAVFLVCRGFGNSAAAWPVVEFQVPNVLLFTRGLVLPLALRAFNAFSRCTAALEVLRLCNVMLEDVEKSYVAQVQDGRDQPLCWQRGNSGPHQVDEYVWQDLTLLKALVLETRAKLLLRGGQYEAGEELCRTCISIRTVMLGAEHPDTVAAQETLSKLRSR